MRAPTASLLLLILAGCPGPEEGLDKTVIRGVLEIPPAAATEGDDSDEAENEAWSSAVALEALTFRQVVVAGNTRFFGGLTQPGDLDRYTIASQGDGSLDVTLAFATGSSGDTDNTVYTLEIYDLAVTDEEGEPVAAVSVPSDGTHGLVTASLPVARGGKYGISVGAGRSNEFESGDYTLTIASLTPTDDQFMVGAYAAGDPAAHGPPVGGSTVRDFHWDAARATWIGTFEILQVREVVRDTAGEASEDDGDTATLEPPLWATNEQLAGVYLIGGAFSNLNASIAAGTLYSAQAVAVDTSGHGADGEIIGGWGDTADTAALPASDVVVRVDTLMPRIIGWEYPEVEPNDVPLVEGTYDLDATLLAQANVLPVASGPGKVDVISALSTFPTDDPLWVSDIDVFQLTVPEAMGITATLTWPDATEDLDLHLYDATGVILAAGWDVANTDPEMFSTLDNYGFALDPSTQYYLAVLGYLGPAGDREYTLDLEYALP